MKTEDLKPWADDVALRGPNAPKNDGSVEHLIRYLLSVHQRFGNTCITCNLQWGAAALWKRDEQRLQLIAAREALVKARDALYNGFEPDNQSLAYHEVCVAIEALLS